MKSANNLKKTTKNKPLACPNPGCAEDDPNWLRRLAPDDVELRKTKRKVVEVVLLCRRCKRTWSSKDEAARHVGCNFLDPLTRGVEIIHSWTCEFKSGTTHFSYVPSDGPIKIARFVFQEDLLLCGLLELAGVIVDGREQLVCSIPLVHLAAMRGLQGALPHVDRRLDVLVKNTGDKSLYGFFSFKAAQSPVETVAVARARRKTAC